MAADASQLWAEVCRMHKRMQSRGDSMLVAAFVTPEAFVWVKHGGKFYINRVREFGQYEIGVYNGRVPFEYLLDDVLSAARALGWVNA